MLLSASQRAVVKAQRAKGWILPFLVEHTYVGDGADDAYDPAESLPSTTYLLSGDYILRPQGEFSGMPGGEIGRSALVLGTDIDHELLFLASGARVVIYGTRYAITNVTRSDAQGEVVVRGTLVG